MRLRNGAPLLAVIGGLGLVFSGASLRLWNEWIQSLGVAGPAVFILGGVVFMSLFVPKTLISVAAGAALGTIVGSSTLTVTAILSAWVNYQIGRWAFQPSSVEDSSTPPASVARSRLDAVARTAANAGVATHLAVRLLPIPTTIISYAMGSSRARMMPYLIAAAVASGPQWLWVHAGAEMASDGPMTSTRMLGLAVSILAAIWLSVWLPRQRGVAASLR